MCSWWNSNSQNDSGICNVAFAEATESKRCLLYLVGFETKGLYPDPNGSRDIKAG